jgi:hypothetical protein
VFTVPRAPRSKVFSGQLHPRPQLHETRAGVFGGESSAYLDFTIIRNRVGEVQGIGVPDEYHRQSWPADMVRALLNHYPDVHFYNSSLNEMCGPLFAKLQAELAGRIAPIRLHEDGGYEVMTSWRAMTAR